MEKQKKIKILILEDSKEDIFLIRRELNKSGLDYDMVEADEKEEYIASLHQFEPDIILSDHSLPQFNSLDALKICQEFDSFLPFILVTGTVSEEFAAQCIKNGADDYVLKSNLERLTTSIRQSIKHRKLVKKKKSAELRLKKQNKELKKINSELDSFVYNISHNLRAPLLSLFGLINLANKEKEITDNQKIQYYLNLIEKSAKKLDRTLLDILDYSRNARGEVLFEPVDLEELIQDCFEKTKYLSKDNMPELKIRWGKRYELHSDKYRLGVIFLNLISNAVKYQDYTKKKHLIEVDINIEKDRAEIRIYDNGIGIDKELVSRVFDMYFRASNVSEGSGLGLYIVKDALEKLGGRITAESVKGEYSIFKLVVPNNQ